MDTETVLPSTAPAVEASGQLIESAPTSEAVEGDSATETTEEAAPAGEDKPKPEKTPEQRELERARRKIDRLVRQREELRARMPQDLPRQAPISDNQSPQGESDTLTLSRPELEKLIADKARQLAPALQQQSAEIEHRRKVVDGLAKEWGTEKFDALASDLDDVFGGLADRTGKPKAATDAIFESDDPKGLIEYLADPDNADEAEALARMSAIQAGRAVARLEDKLKATKKADKPQPSKAPAPLESLRGSGGASNNGPDPTNTKAWIKWRNEQERKGN